MPALTIDEYIAGFSEDIQQKLNEMRQVIRKSASESTEKISWAMPTFVQNKKNIAHFAGHKRHIGFYPGVEAMEAFETSLKDYKTSKGAVQFPYEKPLPKKLITDMVKFNITRNK